MTEIKQNDSTKKKLLGFRALLWLTLKNFIENPWRFIGIFLTSFLFICLFVLVLVTIAIFILFILRPSFGEDGGTLAVILFAIFFTVFTLGILFTAFWGQLALIRAVEKKIENNTKLGIMESYKVTLHMVPALLGLLFFTGFLTFGAYVLFVFPGIIFAVWFSFVLFIFVHEGIGGLKALFRSREYVRGRWWGIFLRLFGFAILVQFIYGLPINFFNITGVMNSGSPNAITMFIFYSYTIIFSLIVQPISFLFYYNLYKSARETSHVKEIKITTRRKFKFFAVSIIGYLLLILTIVVFVSLLFSNKETISNLFLEYITNYDR